MYSHFIKQLVKMFIIACTFQFGQQRLKINPVLNWQGKSRLSLKVRHHCSWQPEVVCQLKGRGTVYNYVESKIVAWSYLSLTTLPRLP